MSKVKYYYDSDTLSYRKIERKKGRRFGFTFLIVIGVALAGFLFHILYLNLPQIETPKEKALKRELANMEIQYDILNKKMDQVNAVLGTVKSGWDPNDALLPLPESELLINPNLGSQNPGYE